MLGQSLCRSYTITGQPCAYYYGPEKDGDGDSDDDDNDYELRVWQQYNDDGDGDNDHHHHLRKLRVRGVAYNYGRALPHTKGHDGMRII